MTAPGLRGRARDAAVVVLVTLLVAGLMHAFGVAAGGLGVDVHLHLVTLLGAAVGVVAAPPVRRVLEQRATGNRGPAALAVACGVLATVLCSLGLAVVVPTAAFTAALYTVLVDAERSRVLGTVGVALATSVLGVGAQVVGLVDGLLSTPLTLLVAGVLTAFSLPTLAGAADVRRQAEVAALALEEQRQAHVAELHRLALLDPLTGLLSRRGLAEPLARAAAGASAVAPSAVLFIDLDGFKTVNDVHGHGAGDELLVAVAQRLRSLVRPGDAVGRSGGDEFVVVLGPLTDAREAEAVAQRVRAELVREVVLSDGSAVRVGASTGVAVASHPTGVDALLAQADAEMYRAKSAGRRARETAGGHGG